MTLADTLLAFDLPAIMFAPSASTARPSPGSVTAPRVRRGRRVAGHSVRYETGGPASPGHKPWRMRSRPAQTEAGGDHPCPSRMDGVDDLGIVDALQYTAR